MKQEIILKLLEMLMSDSEKPAVKNKTFEKQMIGEFVIVRCRDAGVHAGTLVDYEGREVVLENSRRLWYWKCAGNQHTLSGVAEAGVTKDSKIPAVVDSIILSEACEIISTSDVCKDSIMGAKVYETE